jgi:cytochrome c biogenesis protein CcdA
MGTMFGDVGTYWYFVVAVILIIMGLQLAGVINLKLEGNAQRFLPQRTGLVGALILGALFGLVLSPNSPMRPREWRSGWREKSSA